MLFCNVLLAEHLENDNIWFLYCYMFFFNEAVVIQCVHDALISR